MIISQPERTYRQNLTLRIAASIVPAIVAWILAMLIWGEGSGLEPISTGIAIGLTALWLFMWYWVAKAQLTVHPEGIRCQSAYRTTEMMWEEISESRFAQITLAQQWGVHFGLLGWLLTSYSGKTGASRQRTLSLCSKYGRRITITRYWRDGEDAMRIVLQRVNPRLRKEIRSHIQSGETVRFGNVALSHLGVAWKDKDPIPLNSLVKCKIVGTHLRISGGSWDKYLDNIGVNTSQLPNVFVLLDLIDEMRAGGQTQELDSLARADG